MKKKINLKTITEAISEERESRVKISFLNEEFSDSSFYLNGKRIFN